MHQHLNCTTNQQVGSWRSHFFIHSFCRAAFPSHCAPAKLGNRERRDSERSRVVVWAGHRGRGGTSSMGPADRAEGFLTHTHGGPGAGQAREPDLSPKSGTEPQEAPSSRDIDRGGMGQQPAIPSSAFKGTVQQPNQLKR